MSDSASQEGSDKQVESGVGEELNKNLWKIIAFVVLAAMLVLVLLGIFRFFAVGSYGSP